MQTCETVEIIRLLGLQGPEKPKKPMSQIESWVPRHLPVRLGFFGFFGFLFCFFVVLSLFHFFCLVHFGGLI